MIIKNINHDHAYHTEKICTMFFPLEKLRADGDDNVIIETIIQDNCFTVNARAYSKSLTKSITAKDGDDFSKVISLLLYDTLSEMMGITLPWGILYGVRPARLMHATVEQYGLEQAKQKFLNDRVSDNKLELVVDVMNRENKLIALSRDNSFSLYVSIPFCPSRCSYCSFVSHSIANAKDLIEPYVDMLCRELCDIACAVKSLGLRLETIYFGGGTPTTLEPKLLDKILTTIENNFDLSTLREYTVEAGRPDTITREKLETLLAHNVERISINPQTFNDDVLMHIGRKHTVKQTIDAYNLATQLGFNNINMDFIAGLGTDTLESFKSSIDKAIELNPSSVTVHNLSLKSGAYLVTEKEFFDISQRRLATDMVDYSYKSLRANDYVPYYMYRQSKSLGNLENVGYCKEGFDCLYNVYMMDETHTVFAAGAGAVTKLKNPQTQHIDRIYNYKYPYEYLKDYSKIEAKISGIISFYNS